MAFLVKYTITFSQQDISVSSEKYVQDGKFIYDESNDEDITVTDQNSAEQYVLSLYNDNEENLVSIPQAVLDSEEGLQDTEISIDSVEKVEN